MLIQFQPPAMCRVANQQPRLPRATSSLALNACRDGASTASLGNHPLGATPLGNQCVTTLWVRVVMHMGNLCLENVYSRSYCAPEGELVQQEHLNGESGL